MTPERLMRLALATVATAALALSAATAVLADSPAPGSAAPGSAAPAGSGGSAISIIQKTFQPSTLTIHAGDTVTWTVTQAISDPHSVTSGSYKDPSTAGKEFDSGIKLKNNGDSFSHTFAAAGTFSFFCTVHPDTMSGTITVLDASGGTPGGAPGGEASGEGPVPTSSKLIAATVLIVVLVVLFGWARLYQRMNRG